MIHQLNKESVLILKDGSKFKGKQFGADTSVAGEVVFNTGMVGYPETLTDPSYRGQILVLTYPLIGNYGIPSSTRQDGLLKFFESDNINIRGLIISDYSFEYSHWSAKKSLDKWLKENKIPGIYGVDTRELTKQLRTHGVMLGRIKRGRGLAPLKGLNPFPAAFADPNKTNLVAEVSTKKVVTYKTKQKGKLVPYRDTGTKKIILVDCGVKNNIIRNFIKRGVRVKRVPWNYNFNKEKYDGLFVSNGPGDPKQCVATINNIKKALQKNEPIFGICLGSQLMALAAGADTYKLKFGHRAQNQPCIEIGTKRCYITSQNHGYAIVDKTLPKGWLPWFINANDNTNEGIKHKTKPFFAVQFHPEASPGPVDTEWLFDEFVKLL